MAAQSSPPTVPLAPWLRHGALAEASRGALKENPRAPSSRFRGVGRCALPQSDEKKAGRASVPPPRLAQSQSPLSGELDVLLCDADEMVRTCAVNAP
jgi:hypothetical protein